ncbi:MAG: hypothetical protein OFPI_36670 [Osedax symbiont Rs2]|nr:MAG: hypothetical protein OFPI_36670 [Osedax symbiont Rs2]
MLSKFSLLLTQAESLFSSAADVFLASYIFPTAVALLRYSFDVQLASINLNIYFILAVKTVWES